MIQIVKGFSVVNESKVDVFLKSPSFFYDPADIGSLSSGSSAFSKSSFNIWKFSVHILLNLESALDCKEIQPVHPIRDKSWVFIGGTNVEAEIPILWPPDAES